MRKKNKNKEENGNWKYEEYKQLRVCYAIISIRRENIIEEEGDNNSGEDDVQ